MDMVSDVGGLDAKRLEFAETDEDTDAATIQYEQVRQYELNSCPHFHLLVQQVLPLDQHNTASWSRSGLAIAYELTGSVLTNPSPSPAPSLTAEESDQALVSRGVNNEAWYNDH